MKLSSIKYKILLLVGTLLFAALAFTGVINNYFTSGTAKTLTRDSLVEKCKLNILEMNTKIQMMQAGGNAMAETGKMIFEAYKSSENFNYRNALESYLDAYLSQDNNAYGYGIWYDPWIFEGDEYVGPYAYKDSGKSVLTYDYESAEYNYPKSLWYDATLPAGWDRGIQKPGYIFTEPFYDEVLDQTYITMGRTFTNQEGRIIGIVTADWTLDFLEELLGKLVLTESSFPFLIDPANGIILYYPEKELVGKESSSLEWLSSFSGGSMNEIAVKEGLEYNGRIYTGYYSFLNSGYMFGFMVPDDEAYSIKAAILKYNILTSVISVAAVLLILYFISAGLVRPIKQTSSMIREISEGDGDLSLRVTVKTKDEAGELGVNFNAFADKLKSIIQSVQKSTKEVGDNRNDLVANADETASAAVQISENVNSINVRIENLNNEIQSISSGMEEMQSSVAGLNNNTTNQAAAVEQASASVEEMLAQLKSVAAVVAQKKEVTVQLTETIEKSGEVVREATRSNEEIVHLASQVSDMSKVISDIASQTNLLSMNAAIEAAHAGDSGKGFAVVAEEIRKLAENSQTNSSRISKSIKEILSKVDIAFNVSQKSEQTFTLLKGEINSIILALEEINNATQELSLGGEQIISANSELNRVSLSVQEGTREMQETINMITESTLGAANISNEVTAGMQEIKLGNSEIADAMNSVQEITEQLSQNISVLQQEISKFKTE